MTHETKKYLILGGGLIAAVVLGIIVYKKFQVSSQADQAASNQANQDELEYLAAEDAYGSPYASGGGTSTDSITLPSEPSLPSITDELTAIEQAFGLASPSSGSASTSSSTASSTDGVASPVKAVGPAPVNRLQSTAAIETPYLASGSLPANVADVLDEEAPQLAEEGVSIA